LNVRNICTIKPYEDHNCTIWDMFKEDEVSSCIRFISEFETEKLDPHSHNTDEFYYILHGRGTIKVGSEKTHVYPGDLIYIPPNAVHSAKSESKDYPVHILCISASVE